MEEMYLRIGILTLLILPMAISDWRERMVNQETILIGVGVAVCFFIYDISMGSFFEHSWLVQVGILLSLGIGGIVMILAKFGMIGYSDGIVIFTITMMVPTISGIPIALLVIGLGFVISLVYVSLDSLLKNISDMIHKRPYSADILTHYKRSGEKFTIKNLSNKIGDIKKDILYNDNGDAFFEDEKASGVLVHCTIPLVTMYFASFCLVISILFLTDLDITSIRDGFENISINFRL